MTDATVQLWGREIGAVSWLPDLRIGAFQYAPEFIGSGIEVAPLMMPLSGVPYSFPGLPDAAFKGLPGMLADSLPDRWGNALINAWLARQGRTADSFNPVERLCYLGKRGMGALEFLPAIPGTVDGGDHAVDIASLTDLANEALARHQGLTGHLGGQDDLGAMADLLQVGTSAGGARAKAVLAWNPKTGAFRSGQAQVAEGFEHWLLKFDGISGNRDKEAADPQGFGRIEYACYLMAMDAGIDMAPCRLHEEGGRAHFMTRRFDRSDSGKKLHMQTLAALNHFDFNMAGAYAYEQAILTIRQLGCPRLDIEQQFLRAAFNIIIRNQDDHVKNIAFLMKPSGEWRLSPAYDVCYAYNPSGDWTHQHQMSLNGKRDGFTLDDLLAFAQVCDIKPSRARQFIDAAQEAAWRWPEMAGRAGVCEDTAQRIGRAFRRIEGAA